MRTEPGRTRRPAPPTPSLSHGVQLTLDFAERVDPEGADALWAAVFGPGPGVAPAAAGGEAAPGPDAGGARP